MFVVCDGCFLFLEGEVVVNQIAVIDRVFRELSRQGYKELNSRQINAVIRGVDSMIEEINKPTVVSEPGMGLEAWRQSDDTGLSSRYLADALSGRCTTEVNWPHDASDFGRCVRMLDAAPELRDRLELAFHAPEPWPKLLAVWFDAESLYRAGSFKELDALIHRVLHVE